MDNPVDNYIDAMEAMREGNMEEASLKLSASLGASEPTQPIKSATKQMLTKGTLAHEVSLGLLGFEAEKYRKGVS